jgi:hypothetical protein
MTELRSRRASKALDKYCEALRDPHLRVAFHRYAGRHGRVVSIERFGVSAAGAEVLERAGRHGDRGCPCRSRRSGAPSSGRWKTSS